MGDIDAAVQLRILTHYAAGTQLSSIAAILGIDRDEVMDVVQTQTGFNRSKAAEMIRRTHDMRPSPRPSAAAPAERAVARSPVKRGRPAGRATQPDADAAFRTIALQLREAISAGQYAPGACIPGSHALAGQYGVSPKTAEKAVQLLKAAGLLTARVGVGTFVAVPDTGESPEAAPSTVEPPASPEPVPVATAPAPAAPPPPPAQRSPSPVASPQRQPAADVDPRLSWWDAFHCLVCHSRSYLPNDCCGREPIPVTVTVTLRTVA